MRVSECVCVCGRARVVLHGKTVTVIVVRNNDGNRLGITERWLKCMSVYAACCVQIEGNVRLLS